MLLIFLFLLALVLLRNVCRSQAVFTHFETFEQPSPPGWIDGPSTPGAGIWERKTGNQGYQSDGAWGVNCFAEGSNNVCTSKWDLNEGFPSAELGSSYLPTRLDFRFRVQYSLPLDAITGDAAFDFISLSTSDVFGFHFQCDSAFGCYYCDPTCDQTNKKLDPHNGLAPSTFPRDPVDFRYHFEHWTSVTIFPNFTTNQYTVRLNNSEDYVVPTSTTGNTHIAKLQINQIVLRNLQPALNATHHWDNVYVSSSADIPTFPPAVPAPSPIALTPSPSPVPSPMPNTTAPPINTTTTMAATTTLPPTTTTLPPTTTTTTLPPTTTTLSPSTTTTTTLETTIMYVALAIVGVTVFVVLFLSVSYGMWSGSGSSSAAGITKVRRQARLENQALLQSSSIPPSSFHYHHHRRLPI